MRCPICGSKDCCGGELNEKVNRLETELAELIEKAEAVIEAAERHGNVGYADRQIVHLQAAVERSRIAVRALRDVIERVKGVDE